MEKNEIYRRLPRVDSLMKEKETEELVKEYGYDCVLDAVRRALDAAREELGYCAADAEEELAETLGRSLSGIRNKIREILCRENRMNLIPVVNGTGIILHTGLGRAPLGREVLLHAGQVTGGYSDLEFDLETGKRGERCLNFEETVCRVTGAEAAMAVNNNAAAMLLILSALASGGEVVVSRGEMVEIGGGFRIPEIMELGGAALREVGTTNRTCPEDYRRAVCQETKAFLKVHTSNYRIIGYTRETTLEELAELKEETGLPVIQDLGSGVLVDLGKYGLAREPMVQESVRSGADVVSFSGDKLLGGPQAGIIVGKKKYIEKMKRHPLARALRIDKFTAAALEAVFRQYLDPEKATEKIPVLRMLTRPTEEIRADADNLAERLRTSIRKDAPDGAEGARITVEECVSRAGGGSLPEQDIPSYAVAVDPADIPAGELAARLRRLELPVIGYLSGEKLFLDMRTIGEKDAGYIAEVFRGGEILRKEAR